MAHINILTKKQPCKAPFLMSKIDRITFEVETIEAFVIFFNFNDSFMTLIAS